MSSFQFKIYRFIVKSIITNEPRNSTLRSDAESLGFKNIKQINCNDLIFIEGNLSADNAERLAKELLCDPVTQTAEWHELSQDSVFKDLENQVTIEVALRPGVTDSVASEIIRASRELGITEVHRVSTGFRYVITAPGSNTPEVEELAKRLLVNPIIHRYVIGQIEPIFPVEAQSMGLTEKVNLRGLSADELLKLSTSRRAALDSAEMLAVQAYCQLENRDLTDIEFEMIAQTWSEHCVHKTFKALIDIQNPQDLPGISQLYPGLRVNNIMKSYLKAATDEINAPWVLSAFKDNAGILDLDGENEISFKVETHNHPSAIEPFGGANTGVGGVIRDVIGVSARPVAVTDVLCFGPLDLNSSELPRGVLHPLRVKNGVVAGVQDYGNKIGLPTVNGAILFDPGFTSNPLVFCGCVGIAPKNSHPNQTRDGDRIIVLGGRTGRDGLRGATFSSMTMDAQTGEVAGASVQIGDPITEKGLIEVVVIARNEKLYSAITDCGAGGLSSAVGEMAGDIGAEVDLSSVKLKYPGLLPWEIWLSEAQERMVLSVPIQSVDRIQEICGIYDVEFTDIGYFTHSRRLKIYFANQPILDLDLRFLHEGIPQRHLNAVFSPPMQKADDAINLAEGNALNTLLLLLSHPNIASKEKVIRIYDHEVQGGTVVKPLTGIQNDGPSDACVLKPIGSKGNSGVILSNGINPEYGKVDTYQMAISVIDEAVRNAVAVGANPDKIAVLDNFCWGDPNRPETMGALLEAARGCYDGALYYGTPFISGKDSFNNEYVGSDGLRHAIPPTLLISAIGIIDNILLSITMDLKTPGNTIYLAGIMAPVFGGSHYNLVNPDSAVDEIVPQFSKSALDIYRHLYQAVRHGWVRSMHDLSEGGLAVAAAEMCIGGRLGLEIELDTPDSIRFLFGETNGCILVEVTPETTAAFENLFMDLPLLKLGKVTKKDDLIVNHRDGRLFSCPVERLVSCWKREG